MNYPIEHQASDIATEILAANSGCIPEPDWHGLAVRLAYLVYELIDPTYLVHSLSDHQNECDDSPDPTTPRRARTGGAK